MFHIKHVHQKLFPVQSSTDTQVEYSFMSRQYGWNWKDGKENPCNGHLEKGIFK